MKKVVKFGGSSLADAHQFSKVADIIHADESRVFVIPSAPGKRFDGDTKVTDMLVMTASFRSLASKALLLMRILRRSGRTSPARRSATLSPPAAST